MGECLADSWRKKSFGDEFGAELISIENLSALSLKFLSDLFVRFVKGRMLIFSQFKTMTHCKLKVALKKLQPR